MEVSYIMSCHRKKGDYNLVMGVTYIFNFFTGGSIEWRYHFSFEQVEMEVFCTLVHMAGPLSPTRRDLENCIKIAKGGTLEHFGLIRAMS